MASDQFISLRDVPDIYTDSGSDSSDDDSIKALLPSKTRESLSSVPESSITTPVSVPSTPLKKPVSPKRTPKSETTSPKPKKTEKRDLDKTTEPKPKKSKQKKPKSLASNQETTADVTEETLKLEKTEKRELERTSETTSPKPKKDENTDKTDKAQSSPKRKKPEKGFAVEGVPKPQGDSEPKPKKQKKSKNKAVKEQGTEVKELTKPEEKRLESLGLKVSVDKESEVKNKEKKETKERKLEETSPEKLKSDVVESGEKVKVDKEQPKKEKKDPLEVLKKLSNKEIFNDLSKDPFANLPLGNLKSKFLTLDVSSSTDTDTESDSDSDSDSGDSFIKPRFNVPEETLKLEKTEKRELESTSETTSPKKVKQNKPKLTKESDKVLVDSYTLSEKVTVDKPMLVETRLKDSSDDSDDTSDYEDSEGDNDDKDDLTPKPKLDSVVESPKLSGEQFINKERLQTSFKSRLNIPAGCEIYCGNLPVDISEDELRELFEECGVITRINKLNKRGVAFITFSNEESAQKASEYNNSPYRGQLLNINITSNRPPKKEFGKSNNFGRLDSFSGKGNKDKEVSISNEICIRNLNFNSTEEGLRELFGECGQVTRCYVPKFQDSGKPMGICFITFTTIEAAKRAVEYDHTEIDGRTVSIQYAQPRGNRNNNRGRALKGRFTTSGSRLSTLSRPINNNKGFNGSKNNSNNTGDNNNNNSFGKDKKEFKNGFVKASEPLSQNVGSVGSDVKPRSIIFEDSDDE